MATFEERMELRTDLLSGKVPKRMPVYVNFSMEAACEFAGLDVVRAHYEPEVMEKAYDTLCGAVFSDSLPVGNLRHAASYQILGAKNWVMASNGSMQHPEIESMYADEYDEYIKDPYGFLMNVLFPRICTSLDTDPANRAVVMAKAYAAYNQALANQGAIIGKLFKKYGYAPGIMSGNLIQAPFDFVSDQLRGFKGINMDLRRCPDKVEAAVNATLPLMMKQATLSRVKPGSIDFIPLHLAPYMNMEQFEKYYWPTLYKMVCDLDKLGIACHLFAEEDFTRFSSHLSDLPESSIIMFEYGDAKHLKETVGKKHLIGGFFDPTITLTRSKEDCLDEVKRLCDILGPGGRACFRFDKGVMSTKSIDMSKLQACLEWVRDNTDYR